MVFKRRGRPRVSTRKEERLEIRISTKDADKIRYLADKTGQTKTDVIIKAIRAQYNFELFKG